MNNIQRNLVLVLSAISCVGVLGIPLGDPKFFTEAIILESCFVALTVLSSKSYMHVYFPNFIIAIIVIVGNSSFYKHIEIMTTFHPLYNAIVLLIGGYVLQVFLLITNAVAYKQYRKLIVGKRTL